MQIPGENYCVLEDKEWRVKEHWSQLCGRMCEWRHMIKGEKFTVSLVHPKGSQGLWVFVWGRGHSESRWTSEASARQIGQVRLALSHLSTHLAWNSWLQGKTLRSWRDSKSHIHTTHSVCSDWWLLGLNLYDGSCSISALVRPRGFASPRRSARFNRAS